MADDFAAEKEGDFINVKEARRMLAGCLADAKYFLLVLALRVRGPGLDGCRLSGQGPAQASGWLAAASGLCLWAQ